MATARFEFRVLGPLEVRKDGVAVSVGGPRLRTLLALLLLSPNRVVSRDRLLEELRSGGRADAERMLRVQASRLRKALGSDGEHPRVVARAPGYLLRVEPGELDLDVFEDAVADGHRALADGDPERAADLLGEALSLWRGPPLADLDFESIARVEVERLEELRLAALEARIDAELELGRHAALIGELDSLVVEHPLRERLCGQLMLALYRTGRQAEALEIYRRTRGMLDEELGLEPSTVLRELERAILRHDPQLDLKNLEAPREPSRPDGPATCPFKGLATFEAADAGFFFGRERLVDELVAALADAPLIAVLGASGTGKSSLVRAGLLPALAAGALPGSERWRRVVLRPGEHPMAELARGLGSDLRPALDSCSEGRRVVLAVDQFEELFAACEDELERRTFVDSLVEAAWDPERRAAIVIAMRADFFGRLALYPGLAELVGARHVLLGPMTETELRRAISGPAGRAGLTVEPQLTAALVGDVSAEPGGLPLLSSTLLELWLERRGNALELSVYERMGRVEGAVARLAEKAFARLGEEQRPVARRILLRLTAGGDGEAHVRRRVSLADLDLEQDQSAAEVVAALTQSRLLTTSDGTIELAHEALLRHWPRLRSWLEEDVQGRRLHRHLTTAAAEWAAGGGDAGELYRGARLATTLDWAADHSDELNGLEREFLGESRAAAEREQERQRRANRRLLGLLAIVAVALVLAVIAGVVAFEQRGQARREAQAAEAQRLGEQALIEPALDRSLLFAREAVNLDDSAATQSSLLAALLRNPAALAVVRTGNDRVLSEALSDDGRRLAVMTASGNVDVFDTRTLKRIGAATTTNGVGYCGALADPLHTLAFAANGTLAVGGTDGSNATLTLLPLRGSERATSAAGDNLTADVVFGKGGRTLATGEALSCAQHPPFEIVTLRDPRTGRALRESAPIRGGRLTAYAEGGRALLVTTGSTRSMLLDSRTLKPVSSLPVGGAAAVSPTENQAAFGHDDGSVTLVDLANGTERVLPGRASGAIDALGYSVDGKLLTSAADDGTIAVWRTDTGLAETFSGHAAAARTAVFSPDGQTIYTVGYDGRVIAWDAGGERRLGQPFTFASGHVSTWSAVSPRGSLFALAPGPNEIELWQAPIAIPLPRRLRGPVGNVSMLRFSPDGRLLAAAGSGSTVLWDTTTGQIIREIPTPGGADGLAFTPDGKTLAVGQLNGNDVLVDLRTGTQTAEFAGEGSVQDVDFSPDGRLLASASLNGTVTVWDVARKKDVWTLGTPQATLDLAVRFSPDGKLVAVGDSSGTVVLWSVQTGRPVGQPLQGHNGDVRSLDFDPSGRRLVTSSDDGRLRLWDVETQKLIGAPLPGSTTGGSAEFFPDGKHVLGVFESGTGVVWNVDPVAWKGYACRIANRNLTRAEWNDVLPGHPYRRVCST